MLLPRNFTPSARYCHCFCSRKEKALLRVTPETGPSGDLGIRLTTENFLSAPRYWNPTKIQPLRFKTIACSNIFKNMFDIDPINTYLCILNLNFMAKPRLFQYAILFHPTAKYADGDQRPSEVVIQPTTILAVDENAARMQAIISIPKEYQDKLEQLEVALRPF